MIQLKIRADQKCLAGFIFAVSFSVITTQELSVSEKVAKLPDLDVCGPTAFVFGPKIIDGEPAELGEYPWMAMIGYLKGDSKSVSFLCAGSLITEYFVITAGHCLSLSTIAKYKPVSVRLGELDVDPDVADGARPLDIDIDKMIVHEDFNNTLKINDVALIKLLEKVTFTKFIKPICLPPLELYNDLHVGFNPTVAGWGRTQWGGPTSTRLLKAEVEVKNTEDCSRNYSTRLTTAVIDHRVICASTPGQDSCQGDSGAPLFLVKKLAHAPENSKGNNFIMGIVSYGVGCGTKGFPGVYVRVSSYLPWIISKLEFDP